MSAKRANKKISVRQWHSWRPGWMSNMVILFAVLLGAVVLLLGTTNLKSLNVASITGANASSFVCTSISGHIVHDHGNVIATVSGKCNHDWKAGLYLSYNVGTTNYMATCGANQHDCVGYLPASGYYGASSYHESTHLFDINKTNSCNYPWVLQWSMHDKAYHSTRIFSYTLPKC